jgi:hypothetical protein
MELKRSHGAVIYNRRLNFFKGPLVPAPGLFAFDGRFSRQFLGVFS